ncbi:MAG: GNAT family N-acetyltransferase [Thermoanaerobaculia bacterium]|nr:GNAT family N-acetyltransferase [Thermoanaerobaculia bacterium]
MTFTLSPLTADDREPVLAIFNHYVVNSFAAYPENEVPPAFYDTLLGMCRGYPNAAVRDAASEVVGFGLLRPFHPASTFAASAEISYFLRPEATGQGVGERLLDFLLDGARKQGITQVVASISSRNEGSLRFHQRHGFVECGRFRDIGRKRGEAFDVVYCQRTL